MCNAKVIIPTGRIFAIGIATALGLATVANGQVWIQVTSEAPWAARYGHGCLAYDGRIWVFGGRDEDGNRLNDVWYSSDGENWTIATPAANWAPRVATCAVVHDGKMWVLGGLGVGDAWLNDVWWSTDGVSWTEATSAANWSGRYNRACESFNGKMWMLGGRADWSYVSDVWSSADGVTWVNENPSPGFPATPAHGSVVFDEQMCIMGGGAGDLMDDIYCSTNGIDWALVTDNPGWTPRSYPEPVPYSNAIWIMGGDDAQEPPSCFKDVWHSADAASWSESAASPAPWRVRTNHAGVVFDNRIWVVGGFSQPGGTYLNDVWYLTFTPIPALSEWGVLGMTLLVLAAGTVVVLRRRVARA